MQMLNAIAYDEVLSIHKEWINTLPCSDLFDLDVPIVQVVNVGLAFITLNRFNVKTR